MERFCVFGFNDEACLTWKAVDASDTDTALNAAEDQAFEPLSALTLDDVRTKLLPVFDGPADCVANVE